MNNWFLYYILDGSEIVWVGISKNPKKRFLSHIYPEDKEPNKKKVEWARSLKSRNVKPELKVIMKFASKKEALEVEKKYTSFLRGYFNLLNIYDGCVPDLENRKKSSLLNTGKKHSQETKDKLSLFFKQKKYADLSRINGLKRSKKIVDQNGKIYSSISSAAIETGCHRVNIGQNLSGEFKQIKGYVFKYV